jgi:hypothetical protein
MRKSLCDTIAGLARYQPERLRARAMISTILLVLAFVLFLLAAAGVPAPPRFNLVAAGLACWVLASLVPVIH